ncbi:MAG: Nif3-like dinuclear metal center protein, partial [Proteobacteria bacterium]|nr:Nif3-like dinuclear metal center protein [Pseudomonadota bacterium]
GIITNSRYSEGVMGDAGGITAGELTDRLEKLLGRKPLCLSFGAEEIGDVAIITGGAQGYFEKAVAAGADCFITGEASEYNYAQSKELGAHFIAAGHYQTERFGIIALGEKITEELGVPTEIIEFPNPI